MIRDNSMTMLVKAQPLRCRGESTIPTDWRGNPNSKAGWNGGNLATQRESLLARTHEERTAKALKPPLRYKQRNGLTRCESQNVHGEQGVGELSASPTAFPLPADCVPLQVRSRAIGNVITACVLSAMSRQPAVWTQVAGLGQKRMPLRNEEDMPTDPRCFGR
jgi:hypothetical protein